MTSPPLQDRQSGILKHDPKDISDEIFAYLKDIFSGTDEPLPSTSTVDDVIIEEPLLEDYE